MSDVTTLVFRGWATEATPAVVRSFEGGSLRIATVIVHDPIAYAQHSPLHLIHVPLAVSAPCGALRARHALSFTPGYCERRGSTGRAHISGLQLGLTARFFEAACERPIPRDLPAVAAVEDAKTWAVAKAVAALGASGAPDRIAFETMLLVLARRVGQRAGLAPRRRDDGWLHPRALSRVVDRLQAERDGSTTLSVLANDAGLGVSAFVRAFRGSVGVTPGAFARHLRLDRAAHLLRCTDLPVAQIAAQSGFSSPSHFASAFRARHGVTPAQWRRGAAS